MTEAAAAAPSGAGTIEAAGARAPAVAVSGLAKAYAPGAPVFSDVSLAVAPGERVALIGPNGAGKSTLLMCLIGLIAPTAGEIAVLGERFGTRIAAAQRARLRRRTGFVFQRHGLVARRTVLSNVVHGMLGAPGSWRGFCQATAPAEWRARALDTLERVGLAHKAEARADALSGGQAQRVAIARALVREPQLVIADEPAASLDPAAGEEIMGLFSGLARARGITLVFTSHDMAQAIAHSDRVIAIAGGGIALARASAGLAPADLDGVFR